ncbi:MAG: winged helix-turn-helix transcriptional regulator [Proteobacteria bacterium]|nr:winged helix-turn-helix transcriptional regulator [Pseudomonadota bacterium]
MIPSLKIDPVVAPPAPPREAESLAALARALAHPARLEIVRILHERRRCVGCDLVEEIGLAQSTTSEHLRILKAADIIVGEIERPRVCYSLNPAALEPLRRFLDRIAGAQPNPKPAEPPLRCPSSSAT